MLIYLSFVLFVITSPLPLLLLLYKVMGSIPFAIPITFESYPALPDLYILHILTHWSSNK